MLQFYVCLVLVLFISNCSCVTISVYHVPCEKEDAFQSTWNLIKSQVPMHWDLRRSKHTGERRGFLSSKTTASTTIRSIIKIHEIPILPEPKSKYQDRYRIEPPPSPRNNIVQVPEWFGRSEEKIETTTPRKPESSENSDKSVYFLDFKNFKVKFFYNINFDF